MTAVTIFAPLARLAAELDGALADFAETDAAGADAATMIEANHEIELVALAIASTPARNADELRAKSLALRRYNGRPVSGQDLREIGSAGRSLASAVLMDAAALL